MQAIIQKLQVSQITVGEIGISWEVLHASQEFEFFVERAGSLEGPWLTLNDISIKRAYGYVDRTFNVESANRQVYYRVRGVLNQETIISETIKLNQDRLNYLGLAVARNKNLLLERLVGTKCFVFIRRTFGTKCTHCYDQARQKSMTSYCLYCFGTTFEGGYFSPVQMYLQLNPLVKGNNKSALENTENLRIDGIWTTNYPILSPGDLIVEAEHQDDRYVIETPVMHTEQNQAIVEQRFPVTKIHSSRVEMKVAVPANVYSMNDVNVYRRDFS